MSLPEEDHSYMEIAQNILKSPPQNVGLSSSLELRLATDLIQPPALEKSPAREDLAAYANAPDAATPSLCRP
jgi:hypothetical protein